MKASTFTTILIGALVIISHEASAATRQYSLSHSARLEHKHQAAQRQRPAAELTGVIPRAIRGGNPLQMLNPFASPKYGASEENVLLDPDIPGKWDGIKVLRISF